ncbi:hypothetical protein K7432_008542 [Basidiobolus ranarum]|uniref:O-fucosyltransferase family protein n=1 Tax=Basidiobolus ranarum TaxID=34480 RepID=A0ABR2VYU9_9FUNG
MSDQEEYYVDSSTTSHSLLSHNGSESKRVLKYPRLKTRLLILFLVIVICCTLTWVFFTSHSSVKYEPWFHSTEVLQFRNTYPPKEYSLETPSLTYMLQSCQSGFGSFVNNFLNVFLLALDNNIAFHLQSLDWCYVSWLTFFEDFSSNSQSPITLDRFNMTGERWRSPSGSFGEIDSPDFNGHIFINHGADNFQEYRNIWMKKISDPVLERKRIVAQALWDPKPVIKKVVVDIRKHFVEEQKKVFISMHIRRGDKIGLEMGAITTSSYADVLLDIYNTKYSGRNVALFVFSDDDKAVEELRHLLAEYIDIEIFILSDAFRHVPDLPMEWRPLTQRQGYDQNVYRETDLDNRYRLTAEIITDMTLAATADEFICTFSSNIGRLVTLLRNQPLDTVYSLDKPDWDYD